MLKLLQQGGDNQNDEKMIESLNIEIDFLKKKVKSQKKDISDLMLQSTSRDKSDLFELAVPAELRRRKELPGHFGKIYSLHWATNNNDIVSASQDGKLLVWNVESGNKKLAIPLKSAWVMTCAYSPSQNLVASGGLDNLCSVFEVKDAVGWEVREPKKELQQHEGYLSCCRFIDDEQLITSSGDATCILWDIAKGASKTIFTEHSGDVQSVALMHTDEQSKKGNSTTNLFISGAIDASIKVWDARQGDDSVATFKGHKTDVNSVAWFPDNFSLASGSDDSSMKLWDLRAYRQLNSFEDQEIFSTIHDIDFSKSGYYLFAAYDDAPTCLSWNTMTGLRDKKMEHPARVSSLQVAPDGFSLATGCWDKLIRIWA